MKNFLIAILWSITGILAAQVNLVKGEYWFDSNRTNVYPVTFSSVADISINADIDVSSLYDGLHTISIRIVDEKGIWSSPTSRFFIKHSSNNSVETSEISGYEYWFDGDYANRKNEDITGTIEFSLDENIDVSALYDGLHTVHFRFLDRNHSWSSVASRFFIKQKSSSGLTPVKIDAMEYWFDSSEDQQTYVDIENTASFQFEENIDVKDLYNGLHIIHIRAKDTQGMWSSAVSRFFIKRDSLLNTADNKISELEYWFDNQVDAKYVVPLGQSNLRFMDKIDVSDFFIGLHTVHFRFKDAGGVYSSVVSRFFVTQSVSSVSENGIVAYRYWLTDTAVHTGEIENVEADLMFIDSLDLRHYAKGEYIIHMQFRDSRGYWSTTVTDTVTKLSYPFAELQFENTDMCMGDSLTVRVLAVDADSLLLNFGDGETDTGIVVKHLYLNDGVYTVSVQVKDTTEKITMNYTADQTVMVHSLPVINLADSLNLVDDETEVLDAGTGFVSYLWNNVSGDQSYLVSGETFGVGDHSLVLKVEDLNGCVNSDTIFISVSSTVGTDDLSSVKLRVYPNPAVDFITVNWDNSNLKNAIIYLVDMTGKVVSGSKEISPGNRIAVDHLSSGHYLMVLYINQRIISVPIVIRD
ncbi:T9SS type A sorting domain-containing protein [Saccharicrinis sp. FJH62]|uniref:T9SS type A sorting domain-containing protein n=1 Tax=Saccharicrinis sp. FJH62 TaxID=3344657 RepID=UPI0035D4E5E0